MNSFGTTHITVANLDKNLPKKNRKKEHADMVTGYYMHLQKYFRVTQLLLHANVYNVLSREAGR